MRAVCRLSASVHGPQEREHETIIPNGFPPQKTKTETKTNRSHDTILTCTPQYGGTISKHLPYLLTASSCLKRARSPHLVHIQAQSHSRICMYIGQGFCGQHHTLHRVTHVCGCFRWDWHSLFWGGGAWAGGFSLCFPTDAGSPCKARSRVSQCTSVQCCCAGWG